MKNFSGSDDKIWFRSGGPTGGTVPSSSVARTRPTPAPAAPSALLEA